MEEIIKINVDRAEAQAYFNTNSNTIYVMVKNAELIAQTTNMRVYIDSEGRLSYKNLYYDLRDAVEQFIYEKAIESIKNKKYQEQGEEKVAIVELNEEELKEIVRRYEENVKEEQENRKRLKEQEEALLKVEEEFGERGYYVDEELKKLEQKRDELRDYIRSKILTNEELNKKLEELKNVLIKMSIRSRENNMKYLEKQRDKLYKELDELKQKYKKLVELIKQKLSEEEIINFFKEQQAKQQLEQIKQQYTELFEQDDEEDEDY